MSYYGATSGVIARIGTGTSGSTGEADAIAADVENLEGSGYKDQLYGNGGPNKLIGDNGADKLVGNGGVDALLGGAGADTSTPAATVSRTARPAALRPTSPTPTSSTRSRPTAKRSSGPDRGPGDSGHTPGFR